MRVRFVPPRADWRRRYPTARAIARAILAQPALLGLRTRRLVADIMGRFNVSQGTAMHAVGFARREAEGRGT